MNGFVLPTNKSRDGLAFKLLQLYVLLFMTGTYLDLFNTFMLVLFALMFVVTLISKLPRLQLTSLFIPLLLLVAYAFITTIWASDKARALDVNVTILKCVAFSWCIVTLCTDRRRVRSLMMCYTVGCIILGVWCLYNLGFQGLMSLGNAQMRLGEESGVLINSNTIGITNAVAVPFVFCISDESEKWVYKLLLIPLCIMVVLTASRTALLMVIIGMLLSVLFIHRKKKFFRILLLAIMVFVAVYIAAQRGLLGTALMRVTSALDTIQGAGNERSTQVRITLIENGFRWFAQKPIFGYGSGQFNVLSLQEMGFAWSPHNTYTQVLVSYGVIGFLLWQGTYFRILKGLFKRRKDLMVTAIIIAIVCWLISDFLSHSLTAKESYFLIGIGIACVNLMRNMDNWGEHNNEG